MRYATYSATVALAMLVTGCAQSPNVPPTASGVATGRDVSYTAARDGKVYLQDDFNKRLVYSGEVRSGESVRFSKADDAVFVNGAVAAQSVPTPWHEHTLYFEPSPQPRTRVPAEGPNIPPMASGVATGGQDVSFTAPRDGKVYLQDNQDKRLVYSADVHRGEVIHFSRAQDAVFVNGATAAQGIPAPHHDHTMFFQATDAQQASERIRGDSTDSTLRVPVKVEVRPDHD